MNSDLNFRGSFNGRNSQGRSEGGPTSSLGLSLSGFNDHNSLRDTSGFGESPRGRHNRGDYPQDFTTQQTPNAERDSLSLFGSGGRSRNDRSLSPPGRRASGGTWNDQTRAPGLLPRRDGSDLPGGGADNQGLIKPSIYSSPMPAATLNTFQSMADGCGLNPEFRAFAMSQAEVYGETHRHLAQATTQAMVLMEVSRLNTKIDSLTNSLDTVTRKVRELTSQPARSLTASRVSQDEDSDESTQPKKWTAPDKLKNMIWPLALKLIFSPLIEGYTATGNMTKGFLAHSLFNSIKATVAKEGPAFAELYLPPQYGGVETAADAQSYATAIRNAGKSAREKLHNVLLVGIHDPKTREKVDIPVPNIKALMQRVAVRCGTAQQNAAIEAVWRSTDLPTQGRIAYLRREAARLVLKGGKGCDSIWGVVDTQLALLQEAKNIDYETAFYQIIFDEDCEIFHGKAWFKDLKAAKINLDLPSEERIRARMPGGLNFIAPGSLNALSQNQDGF